MRCCIWIFTALLFCALSFPLPMSSSLPLDARDAVAAQKDESYAQDQAVTTKKKRKKKNADAVQQDAVKKETKKAKSGKKGKKKKRDEAAVPN